MSLLVGKAIWSSHVPLLFTSGNHLSSTDDSSDELVATERRRKQTKARKGSATKRKELTCSETGTYLLCMIRPLQLNWLFQGCNLKSVGLVGLKGYLQYNRELNLHSKFKGLINFLLMKFIQSIKKWVMKQLIKVAWPFHLCEVQNIWFISFTSSEFLQSHARRW